MGHPEVTEFGEDSKSVKYELWDWVTKVCHRVPFIFGSSLFRVGNSSGTLVGQITDSMCRAGVKDKTFGCFASLTPALAHMLPME